MVPGPLGKFYRERLHPALPDGMKGRKYLYNLSHSGEESYIDALSNFPAGGRERNFFSNEFRAFAHTQPPADSVFRDFLASAKANDPLSRIQYLDAKTYLVGDILTKVDRMSMAASLEVRVPLLDHEMVEWATRLPVKYKVRDGQRKFLLRKLALKVGVPAEVLDRPKRGFAMPLAKWLREELRPMLLDLLSESTVQECGYLRPNAVDQVVQDHLSEKRDNSGILWQLLMFECWHRNYLSQVGGKPANEQMVPHVRTGIS
jgi:asparagine synthase (glutamine-hydrolysing)